MGHIARLRKLSLRKQRQESLEFASQNAEARESEIIEAMREEKARKMSDEFGISIETAMKVLLEKDEIKKEKKFGKGITRPNADEIKLQSSGALESATVEGKEY